MHFFAVIALAIAPAASTIDLNQQQSSDVQKLLTPTTPSPHATEGQPIREAPPSPVMRVQFMPEYIAFGSIGMRVLSWTGDGLLEHTFSANFKGGIQGPQGFYAGLDFSSGGFTGQLSSLHLKNPAYVDFGFFVGWSPIQLALAPFVPYVEVGTGGQFFILRRSCYDDDFGGGSTCRNRDTQSFATVRGTTGLQVLLIPFGSGNGGLYMDLSGTVGATFDSDNALYSDNQSLYWGVHGALLGKVAIF